MGRPGCLRCPSKKAASHRNGHGGRRQTNYRKGSRQFEFIGASGDGSHATSPKTGQTLLGDGTTVASSPHFTPCPWARPSIIFPRAICCRIFCPTSAVPISARSPSCGPMPTYTSRRIFPSAPLHQHFLELPSILVSFCFAARQIPPPIAVASIASSHVSPL